MGGWGEVYGAVGDIPFDHLVSDGIQADGPGAVDHAVAFYGLRVEG